MAENNPWRDKYRRTLAQQEKLEQTLAAQQAILHRAVTALCAAAEGYDNTMDERLQAIRSSVKHNDVAGFDRMLKSLPRVTKEVEERHQSQWQDITKALASIAAQIQDQSPQADIKPAVKHFKKQLPNGPLIPSTLKRLLTQLSDLQKQALDVAQKDPLVQKESSSFFSRIFKDKTASENNMPLKQNNKIADAVWEEVDESSLNLEGESLEGEILDASTIGLQRERNIPEAVLAERYAQEEKSPEVPDRVSIILIELLDHFKTVPSAQQKATKARKRIAQGLRWFELAPTLEDIRDFVLQAYLGADSEYQQYLEHLYGELSEILSALGVSIETEQRVRAAADTLHDSVSQGMASISQALREQNNIDHLKQAVESHVQQLQAALIGFKKEAATPSDGKSLSLQLQALANKVQQMEKNEEDTRQRLEEERRRALTDSLTGLPNREAYGERSHQEMLRWQRYQHPLTLAVIDIDHFKQINDTYGHQTGDKVLKILAGSVSKRLREVDFMARFGGEEFVILLPETNTENALIILNRIREGLAKTPFRYQDKRITITISIGISGFKEGDSVETVFVRADQALYDAKEGGRNRCCVAEK